MPELVIDGDRRLIVAESFRLVFEWTGERWVHSLQFKRRGASAFRVLAASVEGDPVRDDPARVVSPTYQDLQFREKGSNLQALLVGQSASHHFSSVFEVEIERQPAAHLSQFVEIKIDITDHCLGFVEEFAATYTLNASSEDKIFTPPHNLDWELGADQLVLSNRDYGHLYEKDQAGGLGCWVKTLARIDPSETIHRLKYEWLWAEAS